MHIFSDEFLYSVNYKYTLYILPNYNLEKTSF